MRAPDAGAAGLTTDQYAIMRERVVYRWQQHRCPSGLGDPGLEIRARVVSGLAPLIVPQGAPSRAPPALCRLPPAEPHR